MASFHGQNCQVRMWLSLCMVLCTCIQCIHHKSLHNVFATGRRSISTQQKLQIADTFSRMKRLKEEERLLQTEMKQFILHFKETIPRQLQADIDGTVIELRYSYNIVLSELIMSMTNIYVYAAIQNELQHIADIHEDGVSPQHSEIDHISRVC